MNLSEEQSAAVNHGGNTFVTACPGSGKTRALTARLSLGMKMLEKNSERVLAVTFTNRAADEIKSRISITEGSKSQQMWAGTIHSFALEWIIKPYAAYFPYLNNGYNIADEYESQKTLSRLKQESGLNLYDEVNTTFDRNGNVINHTSATREVEKEYREILKQSKKIDFDQALYFAFEMLGKFPEIAITLGSIFRLVCIDEVQDTQDLQYGILSFIHNHSTDKPKLFIVGDVNQAIYEGIGGQPKSLSELNNEFIDSNIIHFTFKDNYRSTQRIVDYFSYFRSTQGIKSKSINFADSGTIKFLNQEIHKDDLAYTLAKLIDDQIKSGVNENEICVIAPQWALIRSLSKKLIVLLPHIQFDAPSLSPFNGQQENIWLTITKLALTTPSGRLYSTRIRWANEVIAGLQDSYHQLSNFHAKKLLKIVNEFRSETIEGMKYLHEFFEHILKKLEIDITIDSHLAELHSMFFEKAKKNILAANGEYEDTVSSFRQFFKKSTGVVINTCHGVKGEEYETVIVFGLLRGFIPHWNDIINRTDEHAYNSESKLLYVIASRAKKRLFLISEKGRQTQRRNPYGTANILTGYNFNYD
ncbi:UvrD-helicase domain-containing protein [Shewanella colwelliana]|uniref:UvrD-helicase domain-containing protein n=1 Tax=Shewanella colwelliana TaxID=23 RepID=UPI0037359241